MTTTGSVGSAQQVRVDPRGMIASPDASWAIEWWVGADDRWRMPDREVSVRQSLADAVPVVRTAMRVPGGDAVQHVYGAGPGVIAVQLENDSPAPFVVALVVRHVQRVAVDGATVTFDGASLTLPGPPARWAVTADATTEAVVTSGRAEAGPFEPRADRGGHLEAAFLVPLAHRATRRAALALEGTVPDPSRLPAPEEAARGWQAQLRRGMTVELPDAALDVAVTSARAAALLAAARRPVSPAIVAALEDWGLDAEVREVWPSLGWRARRRAHRRPATPAGAPELTTALEAGDPASLLLALRRLLVHETAAATLTLLADLPPQWRGASLTVHDAPTRLGPVSYAVRWHGRRAALLWDAPEGAVLRVPGLDPGWVAVEPRGDALLEARVA